MQERFPHNLARLGSVPLGGIWKEDTMPIKRATPGVGKALRRELGQAGCQEGWTAVGGFLEEEFCSQVRGDFPTEQEMEKAGDPAAERRIGTKHAARKQLSKISSKRAQWRWRGWQGPQIRGLLPLRRDHWGTQAGLCWNIPLSPGPNGYTRHIAHLPFACPILDWHLQQNWNKLWNVHVYMDETYK